MYVEKSRFSRDAAHLNLIIITSFPWFLVLPGNSGERFSHDGAEVRVYR